MALDIDDHRRLLGGPLSDEEHTAQAGALDELASEHRGALGRNRFRDVNFATTIVLARQGIDPKTLGPGEHDQIRQAILRAGVDVAQDLRARCDGDFSYEPKDRLLRALQSALLNSVTGAAGSTSPAAVQHAAAVPSDKEAQASHSSDGPLLSVVGPEFRRDQQATKTWDAQTVNQAGATYRLFIEVCGDRPLTAYGRPDADRFRKQVLLLPSNYSKAVQYRNFCVRSWRRPRLRQRRTRSHA